MQRGAGCQRRGVYVDLKTRAGIRRLTPGSGPSSVPQVARGSEAGDRGLPPEYTRILANDLSYAFGLEFLHYCLDSKGV